MRLLLRADARPDIGTGHLARCLALAAAWRQRGGEAVLVTHCEMAALRRRMAAQAVRALELPAAHPAAEDLAAMLRLAAAWRPDLVVVDGCHFDAGYYAALRAAGLRLLAIEDDVRLPYYDVDYLLDHNLLAGTLAYRTARGGQLLLGPRYALLAPDFRTAAVRALVPARARRLLVAMGGADRHDATALVLEALAACEERFDVDVLVGAADPRMELLVARIATSKGRARVRLHRDLPEPASLMAHADIAVAAAGLTALELAALGVPALLIVTAQHQERVAAAAADAGVALDLGWSHDLAPRQLAAALCALAEDGARRAAMQRTGRRLVARDGAARVLDELLQQVVSA